MVEQKPAGSEPTMRVSTRRGLGLGIVFTRVAIATALVGGAAIAFNSENHDSSSIDKCWSVTDQPIIDSDGRTVSRIPRTDPLDLCNEVNRRSTLTGGTGGGHANEPSLDTTVFTTAYCQVNSLTRKVDPSCPQQLGN